MSGGCGSDVLLERRPRLLLRQRRQGDCGVSTGSPRMSGGVRVLYGGASFDGVAIGVGARGCIFVNYTIISSPTISPILIVGIVALIVVRAIETVYVLFANLFFGKHFANESRNSSAGENRAIEFIN